MTDAEETINPYAYLEKDGFTSEIYKIEIKNLDTRISFTQLKKRLNSLDVKPHKMKILRNVTFVTFKTEEERDKALTVVNGHEWKGRTLFAKIAAARVDPFLQKRKETAEAEENDDSKKAKVEDNRSNEEKLKDHIIKYWRKPYEQQLILKESKIKTVLINIFNKLQKENRNFKYQSKFLQQVGNEYLACKMLPIVKSPIESNYRNKAEFTFGKTLDGSGPITGFCHGKYRGGVSAVGDASCIDILSPQMYPILSSSNQLLEKLKSSDPVGVPIDTYQPELDAGHLRCLTIRNGIEDELLISIDIHPQKLNLEQIDKLGQFIKNHFLNEEQKLNINGILMSIRKNNSDQFDRSTMRVLYGSEFIHERLINDLKFRISFNAFFQVNTPAANVLYSTIRDVLKDNILANNNAKITLLDVCCGTGTIGLVMSDLVDRVVGVDIVEESIENAKYNSELNNISNAEFVAGKAEDVMDKLIEAEENRIKTQQSPENGELATENREFVAIVDPPRGGLHNNVIQAIRRCSLIKKIIYVSCNPEAASINFQSLCRPISKRTFGAAFTPEFAIPVDLFPQTPHVELVVLFSR